MAVTHSDVCRRRRGTGGCDCCPVCGEHSFSRHGRVCLFCHPELCFGSKAKPVKKQRAPRALTPHQQRQRELYLQQRGTR